MSKQESKFTGIAGEIEQYVGEPLAIQRGAEDEVRYSGSDTRGLRYEVYLAEDAELLVRVEKLFGVKLAFRADLNYHVENFKIINAITNEEYR